MKTRRTIISPASYEPRPVKRPYQIRHPTLSRAEHLFVWLYCIVGLTQAESYKIAMKSSGSMASCSAMSSRLLSEDAVREYIWRLDRYFDQNKLEIRIKL